MFLQCGESYIDTDEIMAIEKLNSESNTYNILFKSGYIINVLNEELNQDSKYYNYVYKRGKLIYLLNQGTM